MIKSYSVLGQVNPSANTAVALYTGAAGVQTVCSSLCVTNTASDQAIASYDVAVVPAGQTLATKNYVRKKALLNPSESASITLGMTLGPGDAVWVSASSANFAFSLFGAKGS